MTASKSEVLFASAIPERIDRDRTLPVKFQRLLARLPIQDRVKGRTVAVKMHVGGGMGYSTIHPFFVRLLVEHIKEGRPKDVFVSDAGVGGAAARGYTRQTLGARVAPALGADGNEVVTRRTGWKPMPTALLGKPIVDADVLINLSHVKGHGDCGFGAACKNLAMGCVPDKTRGKIHALEGELVWSKAKCHHCKKCIDECPTDAARFTHDGQFVIFWHHCRRCQHCMLICPKKAIEIKDQRFDRFQEGLARVARLVLKAFDPRDVFHINVLTNITIFCDCWGMTTPSLVPDIGIMASQDIVAIDHASLKAIKTRNLIPGSITPPYKLRRGKHLFEKLHGKDPYRQVAALERLGAGTTSYRIAKVK